MDTPTNSDFGFRSTHTHHLRNCASKHNFSGSSRTSPPHPPSLLIGDTLEYAQMDDIGGETQVLVDEECDKDMEIFNGETQVVVCLDDGYGTCVVNAEVEGETQVLDGCEMQLDDGLMYLGGETEVQDDEECVRNVCSQFIRNGADCDFGTESGIVKDVTTSLVDENSNVLEQNSVDVSATPPSTLEVDPGSFQRSFTSIRAASLRASGLAARCKALVETRNDSCHSLEERENNISSAPHTPVSVHNHDISEEEVIGDPSMCAAVSLVARQLFTDNVHVENRNYGNEFDGDKEEIKTPPLHLPENDDEVAGLSYVDSQEPGESTQANALDFIEKFVKDNASAMQLYVCNEPLRRTISKPASCAKSLSNLTKKTKTFKQLEDQDVSYEWDEEIEDEGGGGFFCRLKEKIFNEKGHNQRSLPQPKKSRRIAKLHGDKTDRMKFRDKSSATQSDSKLQLFNLNRRVGALDTTEADIRRNLQMELNGENLAKCTGEPSEATTCESVIQETFGVGPDTQIAAEAMEALFCMEPVPANDFNGNQRNLASVSTVVESESTSTATILELEKKSSYDGLAIRKYKRKSNANKIDRKYERTGSGEDTVNEAYSAEKLRHTNEEVCPSVVACRATRSMVLNQSNVLLNQVNVTTSKDISGETNFPVGVIVPRGKRSRKHVGIDGSRHQSSFKDKSGGIHSKSGEIKLSEGAVREAATSNVKSSGGESYSRMQWNSRHPNSQIIKTQDHDKMKSIKDSNKGSLRLSCNDESAANRPVTRFAMSLCSVNAVNIEGTVLPKDISNLHSDKGSGVDAADCGMPVEMIGTISRTDELNRRRVKPAKSACTTLDKNRVGISWKRQLPINLSRSSLRKEISDLLSNSPESLSNSKRKRREMNGIRILFSNHLDADVIKHQKKIMTRLGASLAFSISDATHFVADSFVRTRNMLEAIALGKPVVTHLWLESCYQTSCLIDEKAYILRDAKKEREIGFNMPDTLVHAAQQPLLQNRKVIVTPNSKPSKDIVATLVKAVHGRVVENFDNSSDKVDKYLDKVLVLSCAEDYLFCQPFLDAGLKVYCSELLLSGIVTHRLDYARHRLFEDHVRTAVSKRSQRG